MPDPKRVVRTFFTPGQQVIGVATVTNDGTSDVLRVTTEHPFGLAHGGWLPAHGLQEGDNLVTATGDGASVVAVWNTNAGIAAANQIVGFFDRGEKKFSVNP